MVLRPVTSVIVLPGKVIFTAITLLLGPICVHILFLFIPVKNLIMFPKTLKSLEFLYSALNLTAESIYWNRISHEKISIMISSFSQTKLLFFFCFLIRDEANLTISFHIYTVYETSITFLNNFTFYFLPCWS